MDNWFFALCITHLRAPEPCAPIPCAAVIATGTKPGHRPFLWITHGLCQNYPQFYPPGYLQKKFDKKVPLALIYQALLAHLSIANCAKRPLLVRICPPSLVPCAWSQPRPSPAFSRLSAAQSSPACRPQTVFQPSVLGSGYSSIALYI